MPKMKCHISGTPFALQLLIDQIEDEKRMFAGADLTRQEREQMAFNEKILKIATEIKRSHEATVEETYVMPRAYEQDSKGMTERQKLLKARYKCAISAANCRGASLPLQRGTLLAGASPQQTVLTSQCLVR